MKSLRRQPTQGRSSQRETGRPMLRWINRTHALFGLRIIACPCCDRPHNTAGLIRISGLIDEPITCPVCGLTIALEYRLSSYFRRPLQLAGPLLIAMVLVLIVLTWSDLTEAIAEWKLRAMVIVPTMLYFFGTEFYLPRHVAPVGIGCTKCNYNLNGQDPAQPACPECGATITGATADARAMLVAVVKDRSDPRDGDA